jgi:hypothetical protein
MAGSLWTPDGIVNLEKSVEQVNRFEIQTLARMHEIAQKFGIALVCKRCDHSFSGANNGQERSPSIACNCRELRFVQG